MKIRFFSLNVVYYWMLFITFTWVFETLYICYRFYMHMHVFKYMFECLCQWSAYPYLCVHLYVYHDDHKIKICVLLKLYPLENIIAIWKSTFNSSYDLVILVQLTLVMIHINYNSCKWRCNEIYVLLNSTYTFSYAYLKLLSM